VLPDALPEVGPVSASARLSADGQGLALHALEASAGTPGELELRVRGGIAQLPLRKGMPLAGIDLALEIEAGRTERIGYLLAAQLPELGPVRASGRYRGGSDGATVDGLQLRAGNAEEIALDGDGTLQFGRFADGSPLTRIEVETRVTAPSTAPLARLAGRELPALGPVSGRFTLAGSGTQPHLGGIEFSVGAVDGVQLGGRGSIGRLSLGPPFAVAAVDLELTGTAPTTRALATWLPFTPPELGPVRSRARLVDGDGHPRLEGLALEAGPAARPQLVAEGSLGDPLSGRQVTLDVRLDLDPATLLSSTDRTAPGELGTLQGGFRLSDADGTLGIEDLALASAGNQVFELRLHGSIDTLAAVGQVELEAEFGATDVAALGRLAGWELPSGSPLQAQGRISGQQRRGRYDGTVQVGTTRIDTGLDLDFTGTRPRIAGSVTSERVDLADFGVVPAPASPPTAAPDTPARGDGALSAGVQADTTERSGAADGSAPPRVFSATPLPLALLRALDLELDVTVSEWVSQDSRVDGMTAPVRLEDGKLVISPALVVYEQGNLTVDLLIDSNGIPRYGLVLHGDDVALQGVLTRAMGRVPVSGSLHGHLDLSASGDSPAAIAASLGGVIELAIEDAQVPRHTLDLLALDLLKWSVSGTLRREATSQLDCGILRARARQGQLELESLYIDGPTITILGEGTLDLAQETVDVALHPEKKRRFWTSVAPVRITGALGKPTVSALPASTSAKLYAGFALAPQLIVPVTAAGYLWELLAETEGAGVDSTCLENLRAKAAETP
ncbi:MAG TPA: AsmA-like C-terminal region-containing protein, partial [Gammaproteobacteria bacterium]